MDTSTGAEGPPSEPDAVITGQVAGEESAPCQPAPEKEGEANEKPLARPALDNTAVENLANPVKKPRRPVPMTDEERSKVRHLKELHTTGLKELKELQEERDDLRKDYDQLKFCRRCLYARLVNRIVFHRRDAAYVRHQLDIGLKLGDKLPEELKKARQPISMALFMWSDLELGLDNFLAEYRNPEEHRKRIQREWSTLAGINEGAAREESSSTAQCG
uniref:Uncharacterized protein n=1 Tax=Avena sativa TaxID=4498 RepID=A0ACD5V500_AVESA